MGWSENQFCSGSDPKDYVAFIDSDEHLHPDLLSFLDQEMVESLLMPWRLTASMNNGFFDAPQKRFFVFPQFLSLIHI